MREQVRKRDSPGDLEVSEDAELVGWQGLSSHGAGEVKGRSVPLNG